MGSLLKTKHSSGGRTAAEYKHKKKKMPWKSDGTQLQEYFRQMTTPRTRYNTVGENTVSTSIEYLTRL